MKKKLALLLAIVLVLATFGTILTACKKGLSDDQLTALIAEVKLYHNDDPVVTNSNFGVIGKISSTADGTEANVAWTSSSPKVAISSEMNSNGFYTVTVPDRNSLEEDLSYTLTATLVDENGEAYKNADGETYSASFNRKVEKALSQSQSDYGTAEAPLTVAQALDIGNRLGKGEYTPCKAYVQGYVVKSLNGPSKGEYSTYISDEAGSSTATVQVYWAKYDGALYLNDKITVCGYIMNYNGNTIETVKYDDAPNNDGTHEIVDVVRGTSKITESHTEGIENVSLSAQSGTNGTEFTVSFTLTEGYELTSVKAGTVSMTETANEGSSYTYKGVIAGPTAVSIAAMQPVEGDVTVIGDFVTNFSTYAKDWNNSYAARSVNPMDIGITNADITINFTSASSQSGQSIADRPVAASSSSKGIAYLTIMSNSGNIKSASFDFKQWGSKVFNTMTLEYTLDGEEWTRVSDSCGFLNESTAQFLANLEASELPSGVIGIRVAISNTGSSNTQIGFTGFTLVIG